MTINKSPKLLLVIAALFGATGVSLGAYGSHGLSRWTSPMLVDYFQLAVTYQLLHSIALLALSILSIWITNRYILASQICFSVGILFFSGSLYLYVMTGRKILGAITPIGGLLLIIAWLLIVPAVLKIKNNKTNKMVSN